MGRNGGHLRPYGKLTQFIQRWLDLVLVIFSLPLCFSLYHQSLSITPQYWVASLIAASAFSFFASRISLYASWRSQALVQHNFAVLRVWFITVICLLVLAWALKASEEFSRVTLGIWFVVVPAELIAVRVLMRWALGVARSKGRNTRNIAIVGCGLQAKALVDQVQGNAWMGYQISGVFSNKPENNVLDLKLSGDLNVLAEQAQAGAFDEIFIALPMKQEEEITWLTQALSNSATPVHIVPGFLAGKLVNAKPSFVGNVLTVSIFDSPHDEVSNFLKRAEDIVVSLVALVLLSPLLLCIAVAIKFTSKGPVIFKQHRYGIGGESIKVYKFRSMTSQDDGADVKQAEKGDARITPLGALLRKTSLDELPQFVNVLQGRMSVVGPRPHAVAHNELYRQDIEGYMQRHLVKPGITGWAQVNGWRGETDTLDKMEKRVEFDLYYIRHWSLQLDLYIIWLTIFRGFINKNAY